MENIMVTKTFIRPKQTLLLLSGFVVLLVSLKLDRYINIYVVLALMFACMLMVETICIRVIYNGFFKKEKRITQWTRKSKFIASIFCLITMIWTIILLLMLDNIVSIIFHS
jgi:uncharacterized membrane protein